MKKSRVLSYLLVLAVFLNVLLIYPVSTFAEKITNEIPLITFVGSSKDGSKFSNSMEIEIYNEVEVNNAFSEPGLVNIGDKVSIELPNHQRYTAIIDNADVDINGVYTVRGYVENREYSYFIISSKDYKSVGQIHIVEYDQKYIISYDNSRKTHYIYNYSLNKTELPHLPPLIPPVEEINSLNQETPQHLSDTNGLGDIVTIDVMLVYTPAAMAIAESMGGIDNVIAQVMETSQLVLDNSLVDINLRLVKSKMVQYKESESSQVDLQRLTSKDDGYMDDIHILRDTYGADLVALIGDIRDTGGLGWLLNWDKGLPDYAFSVNSIRAVYDGYTLIHEMGHNMGAHHSRDQLSSPAPAEGGLFKYSTGWRWIDSNGKSYASVMTYPEGSTRVPVFSNPDVLWNGVPTGSYTGNYAPADNARTLREIKNVIANYRSTKVKDVPVDGITLDRAKLFLVNNLTKSLKATVIPYGADESLIWRSSNPSVATVDQLGNVTGISEGNATITASTKDGRITTSCQVIVVDNNEISFPDKNLEREVRNIINKSQGPILREDVLSLDELLLDYSQISNIEGLQYFDNISKLSLKYNWISDISYLDSLTNLNYLDLSYNDIKDISSLESLTNIEYLDLMSNSITDITPIKGMVKLSELNAMANNISNIEPLRNLSHLSTIYISYNKISDISPLENIVILHDYLYLDLSYNNIFDISPLTNNIEDIKDYYYAFINLMYNYLDTTKGSQDMDNIQKLTDKGAWIYYSPQKNPIAVTGVELDRSELILKVGEGEKLEATILPLDATNQNLIWMSSNSNIVNVDSKGKVTALAPGEAVITVITEEGEFSDRCNIIVPVSVTGVSIEEDSLSLYINQSYQLTYKVEPDNATNTEVEWTSSNEGVAIVDSLGKVFAVSPGVATITVTTRDGSYKSEVKVEVLDIPNRMPGGGNTIIIGHKAYYRNYLSSNQSLIDKLNESLINNPLGTFIKLDDHIFIDANGNYVSDLSRIPQIEYYFDDDLVVTYMEMDGVLWR